MDLLYIHISKVSTEHIHHLERGEVHTDVFDRHSSMQHEANKPRLNCILHAVPCSDSHGTKKGSQESTIVLGWEQIRQRHYAWCVSRRRKKQ